MSLNNCLIKEFEAVNTYKGSFVVVEFALLEDKPSSSPVLGSESRPALLVHPSLVLCVLELKAGDHQGRIGRLLTSRHGNLIITL